MWKIGEGGEGERSAVCDRNGDFGIDKKLKYVLLVPYSLKASCMGVSFLEGVAGGCGGGGGEGFGGEEKKKVLKNEKGE